MTQSIRNTKDIAPSDRQVLEGLSGKPLHENQRVMTRVLENVPELPAWCDVYKGLSDEEITELEPTILTRADLTRSTG